MIRVLMLDLGQTLVDGDTPFPGVPEALEAIGDLTTGAGDPLATCLVSDWHMPPVPAKPQQIADRFKSYVDDLENMDLKPFFEPVDQRVTLSTHVGVGKPDCRVFQMALLRLGVPARLDQCLFITENPSHLAACQSFGMKTLRFDASGSPAADFSDWSAAPALIAALLS
jgi:FMN phosphatase YigB (HAD superfamily)